MQNKVEIMFEIQFLFSLTMFMKNVENYNYFSSINHKMSITDCKIRKIIHKINLNKIFKINKITNKTL